MSADKRTKETRLRIFNLVRGRSYRAQRSEENHGLSGRKQALVRLSWLVGSLFAAIGFFILMASLSSAQERLEWQKGIVFSASDGDDPIIVKYSAPALFEKFTSARALGWGLQFVFDQKSAATRQVLYIYPMKSLSADDYDSIIETMLGLENDRFRHLAFVWDVNTLIGLDQRTGDELPKTDWYGIPVDWNEQLANSLRKIRDDPKLFATITSGYKNLIANQLSPYAAGVFYAPTVSEATHIATTVKFDGVELTPVRIFGFSPDWPPPD